MATNLSTWTESNSKLFTNNELETEGTWNIYGANSGDIGSPPMPYLATYTGKLSDAVNAARKLKNWNYWGNEGGRIERANTIDKNGEPIHDYIFCITWIEKIVKWLEASRVTGIEVEQVAPLLNVPIEVLTKIVVLYKGKLQTATNENNFYQGTIPVAGITLTLRTSEL